MPKGETSRPLNATQKKAAKTLLRLETKMVGKPFANKKEIMETKEYINAASAMRGVDEDEYTRASMRSIARRFGPSKSPKSLRKIVKNSSTKMSRGSLKLTNKLRSGSPD